MLSNGASLHTNLSPTKKKYKENAEKSINFPMKKINAVDTFNYNTYNIVSIISMKIFKIAIYK